MIVRIWRGVTAADRADEYVAYLRETGVREYQATPGNRGVTVLRRPLDDEHVEFVLLTRWDSMEAVRRFAGPEPERAVFYPRDAEFLVERGEQVRHYEIAEERGDSENPA